MKQISVFYNDLDSKWKQNGITIAEGNGAEDKLDQLNKPWGICCDDDQTIYIADWGNHRIIEWKSNATNGRIIVGENEEGNQNESIVINQQM